MIGPYQAAPAVIGYYVEKYHSGHDTDYPELDWLWVSLQRARNTGTMIGLGCQYS